jgi:serine/threonine-protein kinase
MVDPQASRFWRAGLQSGLIDAKKLLACWEAIAPEKRVADQADRRLARQAIKAGYLTLWQAQQLLVGRSTGFHIDRYLLLELIGQGGMGRVYLARDTRLDRRVAVKILSPERMNNPRAIARFRREARVGAQLQHENLVRIYDVGEANGKWYLVMEYLEGKSVGTLISEQGALPPTTAARLARQVALGLEHANQKSLIHRDVNPSNILVMQDGTAKLTDLGLAIDLTDQTPVTRDGATVGTFDYIAPEQARHSHAVDTRSDIYSLGCTLYHMLSGQVPFPSTSLPEKLFGHHALEPESLKSLAPGTPEGLVEVVARMMRKSPDDRYPTPQATAQALEPFSGLPPSTSKDSAVLTDLGSGVRQPTRSETLVAALRQPGAATVPEPAGPTTVPSASTTSPSHSTPDDSLLTTALGLNLGPEPPLSESISRLKRNWPEFLRALWPLSRRQLLGLGAAAALVTLAGVLLVSRMLVKTSESGSVDPARRTLPARSPQPKTPGGPTTEGPNTSPTADRPPLRRAAAFTVEMPDGPVFEPNLQSAIRRAIPRGRVVLDNKEPLRPTGVDQTIDVAGGLLEVVAAEGTSPVLIVEVQGNVPFLATKSDTPLRLVGLRIVAHFAAQATELPPLIKAGANLTLEHCSFSATGATQGSRAVVAEGSDLTATGCWFEGFDRAIEVAAFGGSVTTLRQCMIVPACSGGAVPPAAGWAVRARRWPGQNLPTDRHLMVDRCTFKGKGLLELLDFSPQFPYTIELKQTAVQADALLCWEPEPPDASFVRAALRWSGDDNQYDLRGDSWVVLAPGGRPALNAGPANLASWTQFAGETAARRPPVRFPRVETSPAQPQGPWDFAVADQGPRPVGADPGRVGPEAKHGGLGAGEGNRAPN